MLKEMHSEITHEMIYSELVGLRKRSEERDATLERIETEISATREIVEAWTTAKNVGRFAKWFAGIIAAFVAIWAAIKAVAGGVTL